MGVVDDQSLVLVVVSLGRSVPHEIRRIAELTRPHNLLDQEEHAKDGLKRAENDERPAEEVVGASEPAGRRKVERLLALPVLDRKV